MPGGSLANAPATGRSGSSVSPSGSIGAPYRARVRTSIDGLGGGKPASKIVSCGASGEPGAFQAVDDRRGKGRSGRPGGESCVVVGDGDCESLAL
jgi:hypothetical protein